MHVRGIRKKLFLAGVTVALLSSGVAGAKDTALAAEAEESGTKQPGTEEPKAEPEKPKRQRKARAKKNKEVANVIAFL